MELKYNLLEHPFYQDWEAGKITINQLSDYAYAYKDIIEEMPNMWQKVTNHLSEFTQKSKEVYNEELSHIPLWSNWSDNLDKSHQKSNLKDIVEELNNLSPAELLGAIHSFEVQQPDVAKTKKQGLITHYGFNESELVYFDEHFNEDKHINYAIELKNKHSIDDEFKRGFDKGAEIFYKALNRFVC